MRATALVIALAALLAAPALAPCARAQTTLAAQSVIDRARAATGGKAWSALRGLHQTGAQGGERFEHWFDTVRYGLRAETTGAAGKRVQGYNGFGEWRLLADGAATGSVEPADLAEIRSDAFFSAYGYFHPGRFDQRAGAIGVRQSQGRSYDVLRIQPVGGEPRDLWFDRRTGLLGVMVDETGPRQGRTELSDYRRAGGVMIPFKAVTYVRGEASPVERKVESADGDAPDRALFSLPRSDP